MNSLSTIRTYLQNYRARAENPNSSADETAHATLERVRLSAVARGDQEEAKLTWCLRQTLKAQSLYIEAFHQMKGGAFYDAWCSLDKADIKLGFLERHLSLAGDEFAIDFMATQIGRFQKLFPYKLFISPAFVEKEARCSICSEVISLRKKCGHTLGEIYDGEMCMREVTAAELLEMSLVENPVQKYSVMFLHDPKTGKSVDQHDYTLVKYVSDGLANPFDGWSMHWTKERHPHHLYRHVGRNEKCPCESGRKYKSCCLPQAGVLRPHAQIDFDVRPPMNLPATAFTRTR